MWFRNNIVDKSVVFLTLYATQMQHIPASRFFLPQCIALGLLCGASGAHAKASAAQAALGDWYQYALYQLAPEISVSLGAASPSDGQASLVISKSLLNATENRWAPLFKSAAFSASLQQTSGAISAQPGLRVFGAALQASGELIRATSSPELAAAFDTGSQIRVGAVFAQQQFLSGLGQQSVDFANPLQRATVRSEVSSGSALRVGFDQYLGENASVALDYQSRVDMDAFQRLRGLFSEPGDFDVPATVSMGVNLHATSTASVDLGVDRLLYSDVPAFTSNALPNRLVSLLGDSTSPSFEWRDLTVYRATVNWQAADDSMVRVTYATRLQPLPSSGALRSALAQQSAARNLVVGFDQALGAGAAFSVAATYSPSQYFLGPRVGNNDGAGDLLELQAVWRLEF